MRKMGFVLTCGVWMLFWFGVQAQPRPAESPRKRMTPEQMATDRTEHLARELGLDAKQSKKVYKLYLKQAQTLLGNMESPAFEGGGRPPMGGLADRVAPADRVVLEAWVLAVDRVCRVNVQKARLGV